MRKRVSKCASVCLCVCLCWGRRPFACLCCNRGQVWGIVREAGTHLLDGVVRDGVDQVAEGDARLHLACIQTRTPSLRTPNTLWDHCNCALPGQMSIQASLWPNSTDSTSLWPNSTDSKGLRTTEPDEDGLGHVEGHDARGRGEGDQAGACGERDPEREARVRVAASACAQHAPDTTRVSHKLNDNARRGRRRELRGRHSKQAGGRSVRGGEGRGGCC